MPFSTTPRESLQSLAPSVQAFLGSQSRIHWSLETGMQIWQTQSLGILFLCFHGEWVVFLLGTLSLMSRKKKPVSSQSPAQCHGLHSTKHFLLAIFYTKLKFLKGLSGHASHCSLSQPLVKVRPLQVLATYAPGRVPRNSFPCSPAVIHLLCLLHSFCKLFNRVL